MGEGVPRYRPERPLPPYAYVPGQSPHPRKDPAGHGYGRAEPSAAALDPDRWWESETYLAGVDLYNAGFHWEAHEVLEALWHAAGRVGPVAELLGGLIKLAAAGVKQRQGMPEGVHKHARRAAAHFERLQALLGGSRYAGLDLGELAEQARGLDAPAAGGDPPARLPPWILAPWPPPAGDAPPRPGG